MHFDDVSHEISKLLNFDEFVMNLFISENEIFTILDVQLEGDVIMMPFDVGNSFFDGLIELLHSHDNNVLGHLWKRRKDR